MPQRDSGSHPSLIAGKSFLFTVNWCDVCGGKSDCRTCSSASVGSPAVSYVSLYLHLVRTRRTVWPSLEFPESNALSDVGDNWIQKWFQFSWL